MTLLKRLHALGTSRFKKKNVIEKPTSFPKTELAIKIMTLAAGIAGGLWAFHLYTLAGSAGWGVNIKLETKVLPFHDNLRLLVVNIKSKNARNVELELDPDKGDLYELRIRQFPSSVKIATVIDEDGGDLIQKVNLLPKEDQYDFIPGLEMDDMRVIVIPAKTILLLTAEIQKRTGEVGRNGKPDYDYVLSSTVVRVE